VRRYDRVYGGSSIVCGSTTNSGRYIVMANPGMEGQYTFRGGVEPLDFILSNKLSFLEGQVIKYVYRAPFKGGMLDLEKAAFYLKKLIEEFKPNDK
jgi:hypothetical protein